MDRSDYVPDDVTRAMVLHRLSQHDARDGFILYGYPRTVERFTTRTGNAADNGTPD